MSEKYKLGLTRNRLFEFHNSVVFAGKFNSRIEPEQGNKTIKLLSLKENLITARVELEDDGEAFLVTDSVEQKLLFCEECLDAVFEKYQKSGLNFWEKLFEFSLSSDGYFVIAGHTCVADAKALLRLAMYFSEIYNSNGFSVEPSETVVISQKNQLPLEVLSPITNKLSLELNSKWSEKTVAFGISDFQKAQEAYNSSKAEIGKLKCELPQNVVCGLRSYCAENCVDLSSVVGFAFYEEMSKNTELKASADKMNVYGDARFFFNDYEKYGIGAYNGVVNAYVHKKNKSKNEDERLKAFHITLYKGVTSTFKVFYDDAFMMSLSETLCDSSYMYAAGCFKNKTSAKLANNYGCKNEVMCDYFSCNLDQKFWSKLENFSDVTIEEPFKMRSYSSLNFVLKNGVGHISFAYKKSVYKDYVVKEIFDKALEKIREFSEK